ncbi:selenium metabolism-associated LysR family transcriptional regulator [Hespellia stercorisuis]|uniref:Transcriptional regulator, LysR family n=1 Tax=Hespellia stercorisuis DSM 15480 TaxID=1121950 RepID=A0A1M6RT72_9FIRM|nr:selenium metabolism-associated LysR family transcriptional regulator [Hespellia stercorisuis]SHK35626.1 transcriptional regulator, LysR family [Hespellia stercorisuis DSM 15480]
MNLKQLEAFVKVADNKSFSKTAKALFLTQPTISAHISSLEKELGVRLFSRNTKEVNLTEDGKRLYQYAYEIVELQSRIEVLFLNDKKDEKKKVTIAASSIPAQYILPEILGKFSERYPNIQFKITETDSAKVVESVSRHMVDIGFTGTILEKKDCTYVPFYADELVAITPNTEKYRMIKAQEKDLKWILREPVIVREEGSGTRKEAERLLKKAGIDVEKLNVVANIENTEAIKKSVKNGIGITMISKLAAQEEINSGTILAFPMGQKREGRHLNLVFNKNYALSSSAERFVKVMNDIFHMLDNQAASKK